MSNLNINYGMINVRNERPEAKGYFEYLSNDIHDIKKYYISLGFHIDEFERLKYYEDFGYESMQDFMINNFSMDKSAYSRCVNVWKRFCVKQESTFTGQSISYKMFIDKKFADYSYSQLCEMLPMTDSQLKRISSDMPVKKIRELKHIPFIDKILLPSLDKYFRSFNLKHYNRESLYSALVKEGKTYSFTSSFDDLKNISFKPGYLSIGSKIGSEEFYSFNDWLNLYEKHYSFDDSVDVQISKPVKQSVITQEPVATSQQKLISADFENCTANNIDLPILKNNDQRKEWLSNYKSWGLWYYDCNIDVNYYKFDFTDGSRLIAAEYPNRREYWSKKCSDQVYFHLLEKNYKSSSSTYDKQYVHTPDSETYIIEFLKSIQKKK